MSLFCNTLVYVEQSADFVLNPDIPSFVYGSDGPMEAVYTIVNVYDLIGNIIGNTRYDARLVRIPNVSATATVNGVTQLVDDSGDKYFIYTVATKKMEIVNGIPTLTYSNVTVQKIVVNDITYEHGDYSFVPIEGNTNELVTIKY